MDMKLKHTWDGLWYRRAFRVDGYKFGSNENDEASIFLNPQSWAVLSGHADAEKASTALESVNRHGPPFSDTSSRNWISSPPGVST